MLFCFWFTVALFHVITVVFFLTSTLILKGHFVLIRCGALLRQPSDEPFSLKPLQEEQKWHGVKSISFTEWQQQPYLRNYAFHFFLFSTAAAGCFLLETWVSGIWKSQLFVVKAWGFCWLLWVTPRHSLGWNEQLFA